jgi:hypothetical protein
MTSSCETFATGDEKPLVDVLEEFLQKRSVRSVSDLNEANLQSLIEICWFEEDRCLSELRLVVDPTKYPGEGRYGFVDLLIASSPASCGSPVPLIELKQVTLVGLCKASAVNANHSPSYDAMDSLRKKLKEETVPQLLQREYCYWDKERRRFCRSSISELLERATKQVNGYLQVVKNGSAKGTNGGIHDKRIICTTGEDLLTAYVVIGIGGTRVIVKRVEEEEQTEYSFRKAFIDADRK